MQVKFYEYNGCFGIDLKPETKEEIVQLVRFGINKTKELGGVYVNANRDKTFSASVVIGKKKRDTSSVG